MVIAAADKFTTVPAASAAEARTWKITVSSVAALLISARTVDTPVAPVWFTSNILPVAVAAVDAQVKLKSMPSVLVVPEAATTMPLPVVIAAIPPISNAVPVVNAAAEISRTVPRANAAVAVTLKTVVSSVAADVNSDRVAVVPVVPEWVTKNILPVVVIAVADEAIDTPCPVVRPLSVINAPIPVARDAAVKPNTVPAVVPDDTKSTRVPCAVPVSTPVDTIFTTEPVVITEVVWLIDSP